MNKGKVYLVGAGPGFKGLLTIEGEKHIKTAEVVVYDRLVSQEILEIIPSSAEKINVGKNVGNHIVPQEEINKILVAKALEGKKVVRLKGGDPFLFGRGGEELELLVEQGIEFQVVPGITSAIAAPSYGGIPVTHRDICSSVHIISGHSAEGKELSIDFETLGKLKGTLVFLMSVASMPVISNNLIKAGLSKNTPLAFIENGTRSNQRKILSTLENCEKDIEEYKVISPATIIVGEVCNLSKDYDWFSKRPLKGLKILVTRPDKSIGALGERLEELGGIVTKLPLIETCELDFKIELENIDKIVFTSGVGIEVFFEKLRNHNLDSRALFGKKIAVVGPQTGSVLNKYGIIPDFIPSKYSGKDLAEEMLEKGFVHSGDIVGIFRAQQGSEEIGEILKANKIEFKDIPVYETKSRKAKIDPKDYDLVTFTSASTVESFVNTLEPGYDFTQILGICIGEQTARAAEKYNITYMIAQEATINSMIDKILEVKNGN